MFVASFSAGFVRMLVAPLLLAGALVATTPVAASGSTCQAWTGAPPPNPSSNSVFRAVAVVSSCNAWAVGSSFNAGGYAQTLIEHWNGSAWIHLASPNPGGSTNDNNLRGVAIASATNVWAVGEYYPNGGGGVTQTLIEHWNGSAWSQVASPNPGGATRDNSLNAVAAISTSDVWAVGTFLNGTSARTLVAHWNGSAWSHVISPNPGGATNSNNLNGVAAVSTGNVWAVGSYYTGTAVQTLVEHWNGTAWSHVASPNPGGTTHSNILNAVAASSASNVWAVGFYSTGAVNQTLIERWNGSTWAHVISPNPSGTSNDLYGVAVVSTTDVWAVGSYSNGTADQTLIENWNGTAVTRVSSPNPGGTTRFNDLYGVAASSASNIWAVGDYVTSTAGQPLAVHCC